ncbi:Response regulator receiver domain-containing protein [Nitrosospira multiformis ATCC 25196]|nr:response regulator [Nitrosospira multiformis]SEF43396.1 Response regulator receiver domain-containing protein [Nitrosospira multiformis ATCC 25196]
MNILVIEDDEDKSKKIEEFISLEFPAANVQLAKSLNSGLKALIAGSEVLDIVLVDMSMPTYDISQQEPSGGAPESFAGRELLAQMRLRSINVPTIVVTMFDSFGETPKRVSLEQLIADLKSRYSPPFKGFVYYNSAQEGWRSALKQLIAESNALARK